MLLKFSQEAKTEEDREIVATAASAWLELAVQLILRSGDFFQLSYRTETLGNVPENQDGYVEMQDRNRSLSLNYISLYINSPVHRIPPSDMSEPPNIPPAPDAYDLNAP